MKISFKPISEVDLTKVFPLITKDDYKLLEGKTLIISDADYNQIEKNGKLIVGPCEVSKSLIEADSGGKYTGVQLEIMKAVRKKAIYFDDVVDVILRGVRLEKNVLLYGKGGHNKSEGVELILKLMKEKGLIDSDPFVLTFGDGMSEEMLLGGINMEEYKKSGKMNYLVENSFMNSEIVVIEEIFDGPPQVLLTLKDILSSKRMRKGNQTFDCKTKIVIALTNRSKESMAEDDSLEALMQRFLLTLKVEWETYERKDWKLLFNTVFEEEFNQKYRYKLDELIEILTANNQAKRTFVSPRTAVGAASVYADGGSLKFISDIDGDTLENFFKANKDSEKQAADDEVFTMIDSYINRFGLRAVDTEVELMNIMHKASEERMGETIEVPADSNNNEFKVNKLKYLIAVLNLHNWSKENSDTSIQKMQELKNLIEEIKQ
jgi:MoxR-like ATPase